MTYDLLEHLKSHSISGNTIKVEYTRMDTYQLLLYIYIYIVLIIYQKIKIRTESESVYNQYSVRKGSPLCNTAHYVLVFCYLIVLFYCRLSFAFIIIIIPPAVCIFLQFPELLFILCHTGGRRVQPTNAAVAATATAAIPVPQQQFHAVQFEQ